jgi:hypothetical protein
MRIELNPLSNLLITVINLLPYYESIRKLLLQPKDHSIDCHVSHEAIEFFGCLLYTAVDQFLSEDSKVFDEYSRKNNYAGLLNYKQWR